MGGGNKGEGALRVRGRWKGGVARIWNWRALSRLTVSTRPMVSSTAVTIVGLRAVASDTSVSLAPTAPPKAAAPKAPPPEAVPPPSPNASLHTVRIAVST